MQLIVELEGPIFDVKAAYYGAHRDTAEAVGWSRLDSSTFWRKTRKEGRDANLLPGAKPLKLEEYYRRFQERIEQDDIIGDCEVWDDGAETIGALGRRATVRLFTLGSNLDARTRLLEQCGMGPAFPLIGLDADPRRRVAEVKALAASDARTLVAAGSDAAIRASSGAGVVCAGLSCGPCMGDRLHRSGADLVYRELSELLASLNSGAHDLIRAGLLPLSLG